MSKKVIKRKDSNLATSTLLNSTFNQIIDAFTGIATSEKKQYYFSASKLLKGLLLGQFIKEFQHEWDKYIKKGQINSDYQYTDQHYDRLGELLDYLDSNIPNKEVFNILKKIFFKAASESHSKEDDILPLQFLKVVKSLSSSEILLLFTTYRIANEGSWRDQKRWQTLQWLDKLAKESGLKYRSLVELNERNLIERKLLTIRLHSDGSGVQIEPHFRLTEFGWHLCSYVEDYKEMNP